jgi:DNA repair protein RAD16
LLEEEVSTLAEDDRKVVVFSSFAGLVLPVIAQRLNRFGTVLYTGEMTQQEREVVHRRFIEDPRTHVMCASLQAAGVGLTWTIASTVYQFDLWWNPQVLHQAEDRVHRIGQSRPVLVKRLIAEGTIEEGIRQLLDAKSRIFEYLIEGAKIVSADASSIKGLLSLIGLRLGDLKGI